MKNHVHPGKNHLNQEVEDGHSSVKNTAASAPPTIELIPLSWSFILYIFSAYVHVS